MNAFTSTFNNSAAGLSFLNFCHIDYKKKRIPCYFFQLLIFFCLLVLIFKKKKAKTKNKVNPVFTIGTAMYCRCFY